MANRGPFSGAACCTPIERETPTAVLAVLEALGGVLARAGFVLRSGGAPGADTAFEAGADRLGGWNPDHAAYLAGRRGGL
jgi:hypothetical protein